MMLACLAANVRALGDAGLCRCACSRMHLVEFVFVHDLSQIARVRGSPAEMHGRKLRPSQRPSMLVKDVPMHQK